MEQYIDKSVLVAEIERLKERFIAFHHRDGIDWPLDNYGKMRAYNEVLSFIDTLEVKEVDFDTSMVANTYVSERIRLRRPRIKTSRKWKDE